MAERFLEATKGCHEPKTRTSLLRAVQTELFLTPRLIGDVIHDN